MNVLLIHSHDTGRYIGPYGYAVQTPGLLDLARQGTVFRNAFCAGPTCSPSRAAMMTGMWPHNCGMLGLAHRGFRMYDYKKHLVSFLNENGYDTVLCGIQHEADSTETIGYKRILGLQDYHMGTQKADWIKWDLENAETVASYLMEAKKGPFFLSYGIFGPHRAFQRIDDDIDPKYVLPPEVIADNEENRKDMAAFMTSVRAMDKCTGVVLEALKKSGHMQDTIVIYTTDHGIAFPNMKCTLYDTGTAVSLIVSYPGNKKAGEVVDALVSHIDLFPTLCELLNLEAPKWLQGCSFLPLMDGTKEKVRDEVYSEISFHVGYEPMRCIRTERYKYIKYFGSYDRPVPSNTDDSPGKKHLIEHGWLNEQRAGEMLFDLRLDPQERFNLVDNKAYRDIYTDLSGKLAKWMEGTADPLLSGSIIPPKGALVNALDTLSPSEKRYIRYE